MDYFAGLDISMDETHICVLDREGVIVYEGKTASSAEAIASHFGESARVSSDRIRDRTDGADPVPRVEPTRPSGGLRRKPAGLPGAQVPGDPQNHRNDTEGWRIWLARASSNPCT